MNYIPKSLDVLHAPIRLDGNVQLGRIRQNQVNFVAPQLAQDFEKSNPIRQTARPREANDEPRLLTGTHACAALL